MLSDIAGSIVLKLLVILFDFTSIRRNFTSTKVKERFFQAKKIFHVVKKNLRRYNVFIMVAKKKKKT